MSADLSDRAIRLLRSAIKMDGGTMPFPVRGTKNYASLRALKRRGFVDYNNRGQHDGWFVITPTGEGYLESIGERVSMAERYFNLRERP